MLNETTMGNWKRGHLDWIVTAARPLLPAFDICLGRQFNRPREGLQGPDPGRARGENENECGAGLPDPPSFLRNHDQYCRREEMAADVPYLEQLYKHFSHGNSKGLVEGAQLKGFLQKASLSKEVPRRSRL